MDRRSIAFLVFAAGFALPAVSVRPQPGATERMRIVRLAEGVEMRFGWIPPGSFRQGSDRSEAGHDPDEVPQHEVVLTRGFFLGIHEVTQVQWLAVMGENPAVFRRGPDAGQRPVESVSWEDCRRFIARVNSQGFGTFRLPTEAEWEYAARAGTSTRFPGGDDPTENVTHSNAWANSR